MLNAGEIGAHFIIQDEASSVLRLLTEQFERLDVLVRQVQTAFDKLKLPPSITAAIEGLNEKFGMLAGSADKAADSTKLLGDKLIGLTGAADSGAAGASGAFERIDASISATQLKVGELSAEMKRLGEQGAALGMIPGVGGGAPAAQRMRSGSGGVGAAGTATAAAGRGAASGPRESFTYGGLGVGAAPGGGVGRLPGGAGGGAGGGHGGIHFGGPRMHLPGGGHVSVLPKSDGFMELLGGAALAEMTKKFLESGMEFRHWTVEMKAAGADQATIADAMAAAWKNAGVNLNTTAIEGAKNILELNNVTGSWKASMALLPAFSVAQFALQSVKADGLRETLTAGGTQTLNFGRGLEELGITQRGNTPEERLANIERYASELTRTMIASKGRFDANMLYAITNASAGTAENWSERFATVTGPIMAEIMKGGKLGNMDYMAIKSFVGGKTTPDAVAALLKYGLIEPDETRRDRAGLHLKPNSPSMLKMNEDLYEWGTDALKKLQAHGFDTSSQSEMNKVVNEIGSNKSLALGLRMVLEPLMRLQIDKEIAIRDKVPDNAAGVLQAEDPTLKIAALRDKWSDLMTALGGPLTDRAIAVLTDITKGLNTLAQVLNNYPPLAKLTADLIAMGAALLLLSGSMKMGKFLLGDLFGMGADAKLGASALALDHAAVQLDIAAEKLMAGGAVGGAKTVAEGAAGVAAAEANAAKAGAKSFSMGEFLGGSIKGGIVGGAVYMAGKTLIEDLFPLTPEQRKTIDDQSVASWLSYLGGKLASVMPTTAVLPPDVNAIVDKNYAMRNASSPWDSPETRRGRALGSLPKLDAIPSPAPLPPVTGSIDGELQRAMAYLGSALIGSAHADTLPVPPTPATSPMPAVSVVPVIPQFAMPPAPALDREAAIGRALGALPVVPVVPQFAMPPAPAYPKIIDLDRAQNGPSGFAMDREAATGRALGALPTVPVIPQFAMPPVRIDPWVLDKAYAAQGGPIGALPKLDLISTNITGALDKIPGAVQPSIANAFASISTAINAAIANMALSARQAAAAIPTWGGNQTLTVHTALNVDGRPMAKAVTTHILADSRTAQSTGRFDVSEMPSPTDLAFT